MCGLCGILTTSTLAKQEVSLFRDLLFLNSLRGQDSTGVASSKVELNGKKGAKSIKFNYAKDDVSSDVFLRFTSDNPKIEEGKKAVFNFGNRAIIGHCRAATQGKVTVQNAHPFFIPGSIIGIHNGTIHKQFEGRNNFETDSEASFHLIDKLGVADAIKEIDSYSSAFVFIWFDIRRRTLNIIKNTDRPLSIAPVWGSTTIAFSSQADMLKMATLNNKLTMGEVYTPKPYFHYSWSLEEPSISNPELVDLTSSAYKKTYSVTTYHNSEWESYFSGRQAPAQKTTLAFQQLPKGKWDPEKNRIVFPWEAQEEPKVITHDEDELPWKEKEENTKDSKRTFRVYRGGNGFDYVEKDKFEEILMEGCCVCAQQEDINDPDVEYKLNWLEKNTWACEECATNPAESFDWISRSVKAKVQKPIICN